MSYVNIMHVSCVAVLLLVCLNAHSADREHIDRIQQLYSTGNRDAAIEAAKNLVGDPDPEIRFGAGYLFFERSQDGSTEQALAARDLAAAIHLIRGAANDNFEQAASFIAVAYKQGLYGLPKSAELAECWRAVADGKKASGQCNKQ